MSYVPVTVTLVRMCYTTRVITMVSVCYNNNLVQHNGNTVNRVIEENMQLPWLPELRGRRRRLVH